MTKTENKELFLHEKQMEVYNAKSRFKVVVAGRRFGKCLAENTRIWLSDGTVKNVQDVKVGDYVLTFDQDSGTFLSKQVIKAESNGIKPTIIVRTKHRSIEATPNHPFLLSSGEWVNAEDLKVGDCLLVAKEGIFGTNDLEAHMVDKKVELLAKHFSRESRFLTSKVRSFKRKVGRNVLDDFQQEMKDKNFRQFVKSSCLREDFEKNGEFPDSVMTLNKELMIKFVEMFLETLMSRSSPEELVGENELRLPNQVIAKQVSEILAKFGVRSFVRKICGIFLVERYEHFAVELSSKKDYERFIEVFPKFSTYNKSGFFQRASVEDSIEEGESVYHEPITSVVKGEKKQTYDLSLSGMHTFLAEGAVTHNTMLSVMMMLKYARVKNRLIWYVAPSYRMAKSIMWPELIKAIPRQWITRINETRMTLQLVNKTRIELKGADYFDSLRGVGVHFLVMDEMQDINPEAWTKVLRPTLASTGGHALFIGCVRGNTRVLTHGGMKQIQTFAKKDRAEKTLESIDLDVYGIDRSYHKADGFWNNGWVKTKKIRTKNGFFIEASLPHPLWTLDGDEMRAYWKTMRNIKVGDRVAIDIGSEQFGHKRTKFEDLQHNLVAFPTDIFELDRETTIDSLEQIFDSDFLDIAVSNSKRNVSFYSRIWGNLQDLQLMLANLGILAKLEKTQYADSNRMFKLTVSREFLGKFKNTFPKFAKKRHLEDFSHEETTLSVPNMHRTLKDLREEIYGETLAKCIIKAKKGQEILYSDIQEILRETKPLEDYSLARKFLVSLVDNQYLWDEVVSIEDGECETFDFTIPDTHSFWSNGFISHNTPKGYNALYDLYVLGQKKENREKGKWMSWQFPTICSPFIPPSEIEDAKRDMDEKSFQQEFLACHPEDTDILMSDGTTKKVPYIEVGDELLYKTEDGQIKTCNVLDRGLTGVKEVMDVVLETGEIVSATPDHRFKVYERKDKKSTFQRTPRSHAKGRRIPRA